MKKYKKPITKKELQDYVNRYTLVEIIPVHNDEPIFILRGLQQRALGELTSIVIHKGQFILTDEPMGNKGGSKSIFDPTPKEVKYPDKFKQLGSPKKFTIKALLDDKIEIRDNDGRYIQPIKNLLRQYGCLEEKRGKTKKTNEVAERRNKYIIKQYKLLKHTKRFPIATIKQRLAKEGERLYLNDDAKRKRFIVDDITIRKILKAYKETHFLSKENRFLM